MVRHAAAFFLTLFAVGCATTPDSGWWTYRKDASQSARYLEDDIRPPLTLVWERSFATADAPAVAVGPPVFGNGRLYVAVISNEDDRSDRLVALRASDGQEEWSFSPPGAVGLSRGRPPVAADGRVYTSFDIDAGANVTESRVFALDPNGNVEWTWSTGTDTHMVIEGPITAGGGLVLFSTFDGVALEAHVIALRAGTGAEAWRVSIGERRPRHGPVVWGDSVVVATDYATVKLRLDNGAELWQREYTHEGRTGPITLAKFSPHHAPWILTPVVISSDGFVTFHVRVHSVSWAAGTLSTLGEFPVTGANHMGVSFMSMKPGTGGVIFAGTSIIGANGPNVLWTITDPDNHVIQSTPALTDDLVFFTNSRRLHVLRARDGVVVWSGDAATREDGLVHHSSLIGGVAIDQGLVAAVGYQRLQVFRPAE